MLYFKAFIYLFLSHHSACRVLVPWTKINPCPLQWKLEVLTTGHQGSPNKCSFLWSFSQSVRSLSRVQLCDPMDCSAPGFPVHHQIPELAQTHVHSVGDAIQPSRPLLSPSPPAFQSFPASGSFPMSQLFASGGQSIGASASTLVLPMNIQGWFPLGLSGLFSLLFKDSQKSSPTPQFKSINSC